jgi:hypothetical protein
MANGRKVGTGYQFECDRCGRRLVGNNDEDGVSGLEFRLDDKTGREKRYFRVNEFEVCTACLHADKIWLEEMTKAANAKTRNPNVRP